MLLDLNIYLVNKTKKQCVWLYYYNDYSITDLFKGGWNIEDYVIIHDEELPEDLDIEEYTLMAIENGVLVKDTRDGVPLQEITE